MSAETIPALLAARAAQWPDKEAVVDPGHRLTYAQLDEASRALAAALVEAGVDKGHRVGLMLANGVDWAVHAHAVMRLGAILVPLSTLLRPVELEAQLRIAAVRHLIAAPVIRGRDCRAELAGIERAALPSLVNLWWSDEPLPPASQAARDVALALEASVRPADEMAVIFTSGSSGDPKGVIHTHGAALRANAASLGVRCVRPESRLYLPMPLFWAGGFATGLIAALNAGCTLLTEAEPEPAATLRFLEREGVSLFRGWPDQAARIAADPSFAQANLSALQPGSLDALLPGAPPPAGARAPLLGMTESFGPYCGYPLDRLLPPGKEGSCGQPLPGAAQVRIVDPDSGALLPPGDTGAIQIGGPNILKGICGREREEVFTSDGWHDTGDLGRLDTNGFLWFAGRRDDMVKVGGASVFPAEVEATLRTLPGVLAAHAVAIELDGRAAIGAAVVADAGLDGLASGARQVLSAFKLPRRWLVLDSPDMLPRKASDKIDRPALRALIEARGQPD